jgi:hypothetical protein
MLPVFLLSLAASYGEHAPVPREGPVPKAPPPAPPIEYREILNTNNAPPHKLGLTPYSIGQPTDEEQLYLEYLNRMRANPTAEGQRLANTTDTDVLSAYSFFSVDLSLMQSEFSTNAPVPPLAFNGQLIAAARWHSGDMYTNQYQGHSQTNGAVVLSPGDRITANGYTWNAYGENVYSYAKSVLHGHAGFAVDWGPGPGGMQDPAGHRENMLSSSFREVGVGVVDGLNGSVGPQLVTQDFGSQPSAKPFITGVVYYDFNGNGFYDAGEGIGGVTANTAGSTYYAVTANSGGYAIPITSNGNYTITFSASGLSTQTVVTVSEFKNVKLDYLPVYSPPIISGPNPAGLNQSNYYTFTPVATATGYQWLQTQLGSFTAVEGAENGLANVTVVSSAGYSMLASDIKASGSFSFHLAQPDAGDQFLRLNPVIRPSATSQLTFAKRLGWAASGQVAEAQVSTDGGGTWQSIWSQAGSGNSGDSSFTTVPVALGEYAGQNMQIRFAYVFTGGTYFPQTDSGVALYLDNIAVSNAEQLLNQVTNNVSSGTSFVFSPSSTGQYLLQVRAQIGNRVLNWGPGAAITGSVAAPTIQLANSPAFLGSQFQVDFTVANYSSGMTFELWKAAALSGSWTLDSSASLQTLVPNSKFRFTTPTGGASRSFYRVRGNY